MNASIERITYQVLLRERTLSMKEEGLEGLTNFSKKFRISRDRRLKHFMAQTFFLENTS